MPLDQLLAALQREAQAEADRLLAEARRAAADLSAIAEAAVAREREHSLGARMRLQQAELEATLSAARLSARREVLEARERLLVRLFEILRSACPAAVTRPEYVATLPHRIAAALSCVDESVKVHFTAPASLLDRIGAALPDEARVSVRQDAEVGSGFRATSDDGSVEIVDTLESRIDGQKAILSRQALHLLGVG
jgi:vacuolar-type H+-ATPase subunit E/Vma4